MKIGRFTTSHVSFLPKRVLMAVLLGCGLALGIIGGISATTIAHVEQVQLAGNVMVYGSNTLYGMKLYENLAQKERALAAANKQIERLVLIRKWPNTITIVTVARKPLAVIQTERGTLTLDREAYILKRERRDDTVATGSALPEISFYQHLVYDQYQVGDRLAYDEIQKALQILGYLKEREGFQDVDIAISSQNVIRCRVDGAEVLFAAEKSVETQGFVLHQLLEQFARSGRTYRTIDLRFDKPVVVF